MLVKNSIMYILIMPDCKFVVVLIGGSIWHDTPFGPNFSYHNMSVIWVEIFCPKFSFIFGVVRCTIVGKKASIFEKVWIVLCFGEKLEMSIATISPTIVTIKAVSFIIIGIVRTCVFIGRVQLIISMPAIILPQANRVIGLMIKGLFSLIVKTVRDRGVFIDEKKIIRKLYTAVKEVAIRVRIRAHEFRLEMFIDSIIASLEKNPERYGVPVRARLPMVRQVVVIGSIFCRPPIFRISCSSFRL